MPESLPTDGKNKYEWQTGYAIDENNSINPQKYMRKEARYLGIIMILAFVAIIANYKGFFVWALNVSEADVNIVTRIVYCLSAGLLGGVTFSIKVFYRAVARGQWHYDRRYWRYFSPIISISVTSVIAAIMIEDVVNSNIFWSYVIGYFAGYFSEHAVGKMYDVAVILFSAPAKGGSKEIEDEKRDDKGN